MTYVRWLPIASLCLACHAASRGTAPLDSPATPAADTLVVDQAAVLAEVRAYYDDVNAGDHTRYSAHFWPGATRTIAWIPRSSTHPVVSPRFDSDSLRDS